MKDQCHESCTTFEALSACLWKCRTVALQPDPRATVQLTFFVNVRERLQGGDNGLPQGYYGNAIVSAAAATTAKLLCTNPVSYASELIREAKNAVNDDYVKSVADLMVLKARPKLPILKNFLIADNTRLGFDEVDFGWGRPMFGGVVSVGYGVGYLVPHKRMEDRNGVLVALALPPLVMGKFQNEIRKMLRA